MGQGGSSSSKAGSSGLRKAGDFLNNFGFPHTHDRYFPLPMANKPHRVSICRCWYSVKFPICDNTHQRLQKEGVNVGPVMLEVRRPGVMRNVAAGLVTAMTAGAVAYGIVNLGGEGAEGGERSWRQQEEQEEEGGKKGE